MLAVTVVYQIITQGGAGRRHNPALRRICPTHRKRGHVCWEAFVSKGGWHTVMLYVLSRKWGKARAVQERYLVLQLIL